MFHSLLWVCTCNTLSIVSTLHIVTVIIKVVHIQSFCMENWQCKFSAYAIPWKYCNTWLCYSTESVIYIFYLSLGANIATNTTKVSTPSVLKEHPTTSGNRKQRKKTGKTDRLENRPTASDWRSSDLVPVSTKKRKLAHKILAIAPSTDKQRDRMGKRKKNQRIVANPPPDPLLSSDSSAPESVCTCAYCIPCTCCNAHALYWLVS